MSGCVPFPCFLLTFFGLLVNLHVNFHHNCCTMFIFGLQCTCYHINSSTITNVNLQQCAKMVTMHYVIVAPLYWLVNRDWSSTNRGSSVTSCHISSTMRVPTFIRGILAGDLGDKEGPGSTNEVVTVDYFETTYCAIYIYMYIYIYEYIVMCIYIYII